MKNKTILLLTFFIAIFFAMLIIPNKVMAVQSITSVEVTNEIPQFDKKLTNNNATVTAKVGNNDCDKAIVNSSTWYVSQDGTNYNLYNTETKINRSQTSIKLVTEIQINDANYVFSNSLTATGKAVQGYNTVDVSVNDSKHATITSIYYQLDLTVYSPKKKLYFMDTTNMSLYVSDNISYHLPGTTVSLAVKSTSSISTSECNYYPTDVFVRDTNDPTNSEKYLFPVQGEDQYHYTFVMPAYVAEINNTDTKKVNAEVIWKGFDFVEYGSGYYKFDSSGTNIERITNEGQYYLYNFHFDLDTMTLTVKNVSESGEGQRINYTSYYFSNTQNYLYVRSLDSGPENFTLKIDGYFHTQMPADNSLESIPIMVLGANLIIENDSNNYESVLNLENSDNITRNNSGIYCDKKVSIINHNTDKQDSLRIITKTGKSDSFGVGILASDDIFIQNADLKMICSSYTSGNITSRGISGIFSAGNITLKDSNLYMEGDLLGGIQSSQIILLDGGNYKIRTFLQSTYYPTYSLWAKQDIIVKNQAVLDVTGEYFIGIKNDEKDGTIKELDLSQYNSSYRILVEETYMGSPERKEWNGTTPLSCYPYFVISPGTPTGQDVYEDKVGLKTIDITITEPEIGEYPAESGTITGNINITDYFDVEWYWYQNAEGPGVRSRINSTTKIVDIRYYFLCVYLKPKTSVSIDKTSLRTIGNVKINGKNVIHNEYGSYPGCIDFNQPDIDSSSARNIVIWYAYGLLGENRTIAVKSYDMTLEKEASGGEVQIITDKDVGVFDVDGYSKKATFGTNVEINASAYEGYEFVEWRLENPTNGTVFSKESSLELKPDQDLTIYAIFKQIKYNISVHSYNLTLSQPDSGGTTYLTTKIGTYPWSALGTSKEIALNTSTQIGAWPNTGYEFVEWRIGNPGGMLYTKDEEYTFQATEDLDLYAVFRDPTIPIYTISVRSYDITEDKYDGGGTIKLETDHGTNGFQTVGYSEDVTPNTKVQLGVKPKKGYEFIGWRIGGLVGKVLSTDLEHEFTATKNLKLYAMFRVKNEFTVTFKDYDGTVLKTEKVQKGNGATAPKNPTREGYTFSKWDKDFSNITDDLTVTAVYTKNKLGDIDITPYMFNAKFYADANLDLKKAFGYNESALKNHYLNWGINEGRQASVIFNPVYYLDNNKDVKQAFGNNYQAAYNHFIQFGAREGRTASREFSVKYYLEMNEDVAVAVDYNYTRAIEHYVLFGINEGRLANNSPINISPYLFDRDLYYSLYADLQSAIGNNENSLRNHFINWGCSEGRIASYVFDSKYYLDNNDDVKKAFGNNYKQAYEHFINFGINEGRVGSKYFDAKYYLEKNEDLRNVFKTNYSKALEHFVNYGINEGRLASKTFNVKVYKNKNADLSKEFGNNWKQYFRHYIIWGQKENRKCV